MLRINPNAEVQLREIADGQYCAIVDDVLENAESLVEFAVRQAHRFEWWSVPPGPRLIAPDNALQDLKRLVRSKLSRHFPILRTGLSLRACLANVTVPPEQLSHLQRLCHVDESEKPNMRYFAGLIYLFRNPDLGGTAFYRWKKPEVMARAEQLHEIDPAACERYLETSLEIFRKPPQYMTESNDLAELLSVVPARFNRLVFYDGSSPHTGHITHPELLSDDLSRGRLTLNFFTTALAR
ncbi:MAG: DUF6445 family protein [Xanthomonadales bacterium]|jgi:hypothetical protein|nr:DUF6445 family protein [Xanthomonadales bacterium]